MIIIDLRFKKDLEETFSIKLNEIARNKIPEFHNFISKISQDNKNNFDWWVSSPSGRYTLASPLYFNFCSVFLLEYILKNDCKVDQIIVDNKEIKYLFEKLIERYNKFIRIKIYESNYKYIKLKLQNSISILKQFFYRIIQFIICKIIKNKDHIIYSYNLILIDKYVFPGYVENERYYIGLFDYLNDEQKKQIYFVPTIVMFKFNQLWEVYNKLNNSKDNYLFKENYINLFDIIYAIFYFFRKRRINLKNNYVCDLDLSNVIRTELEDNLISYVAAVESILTLRFIKKIKKLKYNIKLSIDWFENQIMDRGWNYGFNKHFPNTKSIGYRGLVPSDLLLSEMYPTDNENTNLMLPKKIYVIGEGFKENIKRFGQSINVGIAPAFRFQHIWNRKYIPSNDKFVIFVALPISFDDSVNIFNIIIDSFNYIKNEDLDIYIKPHPTIFISDLIKNINFSIPYEFKILQGNTEDIILKSNLLISGMSSICLEGIAIGVPLLIVENTKRLNYRTVPNNISKHLYKYCFSKNDLIDGILQYKNLDSYKKNLNKIECEKIKIKYFQPVTKENVLNFLEI